MPSPLGGTRRLAPLLLFPGAEICSLNVSVPEILPSQDTKEKGYSPQRKKHINQSTALLPSSGFQPAVPIGLPRAAFCHIGKRDTKEVGVTGPPMSGESSTIQGQRVHVCKVASVISDSLQPYVAHQAPLSLGFSRQEYWSGLPFPSPGDLSNLGIKPVSLASPALAGGFFTTRATWEAQNTIPSPRGGKNRTQRPSHCDKFGSWEHRVLSPLPSLNWTGGMFAHLPDTWTESDIFQYAGLVECPRHPLLKGHVLPLRPAERGLVAELHLLRAPRIPPSKPERLVLGHRNGAATRPASSALPPHTHQPGPDCSFSQESWTDSASFSFL